MTQSAENRVCVTLDIDWASDAMIDQTARILLDNNVPATWFVTHASAAVDRLRDHPDLFELGIHPNFLPGSTHGEDMESILRHCLDIVPEAVSSRSHAVVQSGRLLQHLQANTPIKNECSTFLPEMAGLYPLRHPLPGGMLTRVPFFWADDYQLCKAEGETGWTPEPLLEQAGLKVFTFHPVHVAINTPTLAHYEAHRVGEAMEWDGPGARSYLTTLCQRLGDGSAQACRILDLDKR